MTNFDKNKILERILEEAPTLSNRRGEIKTEGPVVEKRAIYAFYGNLGIPDPDLHYHRKNNPLPTTPDSTLCEIYSFWEGDPNVQELIKRKIKEGRMKEGDVMHQGPFVTGDHGHHCEEPKGAREGEEFNFLHSACAFERHFNEICKEFGYEPRIGEAGWSGGCLTLKLPGQVSLSIGGKISNHDIGIKMPIGINFYREDPTLSNALEAISKTYEKLQKNEFSDVVVNVYSKEEEER